MEKNNRTEMRKKKHVEIVLRKFVQYKKSAGFENVEFIHNALPEVDFDKIDLSTKFLGKRIAYPLIISAMTGGYEDAGRINRALAAAADKFGIALGIGSQRAMVEKPSLKNTYMVREVAPDIPLLANIGAAQLKKYTPKQIEGIVSDIEADGLAVHLNVLQEVIQWEGDKDYSGVLDAISKMCDILSVPVVVKETGAGISKVVACRLKEAGVAYIDVAGAGGTSWSKVEYLRGKATPGFEEWGIPTVDSILMCKGVLPLIGSGGVRSGIDVAKAIALGADLAGAASPFLKAVEDKKLDEELMMWIKQMKITAMLSGASTIDDLKSADIIIKKAMEVIINPNHEGGRSV